MFDVSYWSYSKVALKQSLTAMQDPSVEELALKVFNSILIYSGVIDAGRDWGWVLAKKILGCMCSAKTSLKNSKNWYTENNYHIYLAIRRFFPSLE